MTAAELVAFVRDRASVPNTTKWTDQKIVDAANEVLRVILTEDLVKVGSEFLTEDDEIPVTGGVANYRLPARAASNAERLLTFVDSNGVESAPLIRRELSELYRYGTTTGQPEGFVFNASGVQLLPIPIANGTLRCKYARQSGALVLDTLNGSNQHTDVGTIASVTAAVVTLQAAHSGFPAGGKVDITSATPHFALLGKDLAVTGAAAGLTVDLTAAGVDLTKLGIQPGDFLTLARKSFVPQLPLAWHDLLMLRAAAAMQDRLKDYKGARETLSRAMEMEKRLINVALPRGAQNSKRISAWRGMRRNRYVV